MISSSSTSKPSSLSRSIRCSIRHISAVPNSSTAVSWPPERVVPLGQQVDDLVRPDVGVELLAGLEVEQLGEDVLARHGQVVLAHPVRQRST